MEKLIHIKDIKDTKRLAKLLAKLSKEGDIFLLNGDLGTGKTTFVKAFSKALGFNEDDITSPTFTLVNVYETPIRLIHADLYRIGKGADLFSLGIEEYIDRGYIALIEWAQYLSEPPEEQTLTLTLEFKDINLPQERIIKLSTKDPLWKQRIDSIA